MLDDTTPKGRIASAALRLAAQKPWTEVTLLDIAETAGMSLSGLRDEFHTKSDILVALVRAIDDEVLKRAPKPSADQDRRDALFDIIMSRFDVLAPHKAALKSIHAAGVAEPALARAIFNSQHWMLQAAGIGTDGPGGRLRVGGLALLYASVFRTWLEDDDPGLARTMAALDRRLRRGERTVRNAEQMGSVLYRFATDTPGFIRSVMRGRRKPDPKPDPNPGAEAGTV